MPSKAQIIQELDNEGKMAFGKHYGTYFVMIDKEYFNWVYNEIPHAKLARYYPNLWQYLCETFNNFSE